MGNFFTSTQIFNKEQLNNKEFIDTFCNKMKEAGYVTCESDEAEKSYVLKFADNCKWVTITSEDYEQGNQTALNDTSRIAKMLKTSCVNTTVIDSDCTVMELFDEDGNKADTLIMGRADDYFGDNFPLPSENAWKLFLSDGSSWEKLCEIINNSESYVFVEDGLSELAPLIGMDERNITFSFDNISEVDNTVFLSFMNVNGKKKNKLSLKSALFQVFGKTLEPLGFIRINSKFPYYVRLINGEILHVITYNIESHGNCYSEFNIMCGVATVFRPSLSLDLSPRENNNWLEILSEFYRKLSFPDIDEQFYNSIYNFKCKDDDVIDTINKSLETVTDIVVPVLNNVTNIEECIEYFLRFNSDMSLKKNINDSSDFSKTCFYNEGLLYILTNKYGDYMIKKSEHIFAEAAYKLKVGQPALYIDSYGSVNRYTNDSYNEIYEKFLYEKEGIIKRYNEIYNDTEWINQARDELKRRKNNNIKLLRSYGLLSNN